MEKVSKTAVAACSTASDWCHGAVSCYR
jgi:hypothetical protein